MPSRRLLLIGRVVVAATVGAGAVSGLACSDEPERSVASYCSHAEVLTTLEADLASGDASRIQARADDLRLLQQVAPPEIEPSISTLLGVTDDFARTAGTATDRADVADAVFQGRADEIESIEAASSEVATYTAATCRIDVAGTGSTAVPGSSPGTAPGPGTAPDPSTSTPSTTTTNPDDGATSTTTSTPSLLVD